MRKFILILIVITIAFDSMGQFVVPKYGKVSREELVMNVYPKDSSANAVFLFDEGSGKVFFNGVTEKWELKFERHGRIKILTKEGVGIANILIPLHSGNGTSEKLTDFDAVVYNLENENIVKLKASSRDLITEEVSSNFTKKKVAIPGCKVGTVIDFHYIINSDYLFNFYAWEFQQTIPVVYSQYDVSIPEYFTYNVNSSGFEKISSVNVERKDEKVIAIHRGLSSNEHQASQIEKYEYEVKYATNSRTYVSTDVPALSLSEAYVDNIYNYQTRLDFELAQVAFPQSLLQSFSTTWEKVVDILLMDDDFGQQLNGGGYLDDDLAALVVDTIPEKKMLSIFDFIQSKIKWNEKYRLLVKDGVRRAYKDGVGNSAEVNLNLVLALRKVGLSAFPVVLSTRDNGVVNPLKPTINNFNHVIAAVFVGEKYYLLDATSRFSAINVLPFQDVNGNGRIVDVNRNKWLSLDPSFISRMRSCGTFTFLPDGSVTGNLQQSYKDYFVNVFHVKYGENDYFVGYEEAVKKAFGSETMDSLNIVVGEHGSSEISVSTLIKPDGVASVVGDLMYLNPCVGFNNSENRFSANERKYSVNFGVPQEENYINQFVIPDGYALVELPQPMVVALPNNGGKYTYSCSLSGNKLMVVTRLTIQKPVYPSADYARLKGFFDQIAAKQNQKVILRKV